MKVLSLFSAWQQDNRPGVQVVSEEISSGYKESVLHHGIGSQGNGTISPANSASHDPE